MSDMLRLAEEVDEKWREKEKCRGSLRKAEQQTKKDIKVTVAVSLEAKVAGGQLCMSCGMHGQWRGKKKKSVCNHLSL